jgi:hypothetical protein
MTSLPLENGAASQALKEYEAELKTAPRRFNATAGIGVGTQLPE